MQITDYTNVKSLLPSDMLIVDGTDGTRSINASALITELMEFLPPETHRMIFRGKNLGEAYTDIQKTEIKNGTFKDLWIGDYWIIKNTVYRIVDIDYFYTDIKKQHHLVVMPDHYFYSAKMNSTTTTTGGYVGSEMYTTNLNEARNTISSAFYNSVWDHSEYLSNAVTDGIVTGRANVTCKVEIPNETMMYGHTIYASQVNDGVTINQSDSCSRTQFALFSSQPKFISDSQSRFWLRDIVSSERFARADPGGVAYHDNASVATGVRPYFCVR